MFAEFVGEQRTRSRGVGRHVIATLLESSMSHGYPIPSHPTLRSLWPSRAKAAWGIALTAQPFCDRETLRGHLKSLSLSSRCVSWVKKASLGTGSALPLGPVPTLSGRRSGRFPVALTGQKRHIVALLDGPSYYYVRSGLSSFLLLTSSQKECNHQKRA